MFYVYTLADPRCGTVFYVGKGKGARMHQHVADAKRGRILNRAKHQRIIEILDAGAEVVCAKVFHSEDEAAAFDREIDLIAEIGLDRLTNILPGGQGCAMPMTPEQRREAAMRYKAARLTLRVKRLAQRFATPGTFPFERDGVRMGREYTAALRSLSGEDVAPSYRAPDRPNPRCVHGRRSCGAQNGRRSGTGRLLPASRSPYRPT